jgi:general secretion pathway protein D
MQIISQSDEARRQTEFGLKMSLWLRYALVVFVLYAVSSLALAQTTDPSIFLPAQSSQNQPALAPSASLPTAASGQSQLSATTASSEKAKLPRSSDRRRATKLFQEASKLFMAEKFEEAMQAYQKAAKLDPSNVNYPLAAEVARNHAVTALIQVAAKYRQLGNFSDSRAALARALELNPKSEQVSQHLYQLSQDALTDQTKPLYEKAASTIGSATVLSPAAGTHSFHLRTDQRQTIQQVFKAYGIEVTLDESVRSASLRFNLDDANFTTASQVLSLVTNTFFVPLDAHRVLVARNTKEIRQKFLRQISETVYLPGLTASELTEAGKLAKDIFDAQQSVVDPSAGTITLRASSNSVQAFNATMGTLLDGRNQVILDVRILQLAHNSEHNTGVTLPQSSTAYNVYTEEQSILTANADTVSEIISSGLASANDPVTIIGILIAAGDVSSSLFSNGIATFGGGLTLSALSPGSTTFNLNLNSSDSRQLDNVQLRLGDGEEGKLRIGERYPIQTSSYSNLLSSSSSIAGLTSAGTSSSLTALLASLTSSTTSTIPMVEYQDLGLTLKAIPKIMRGGDVALTLDLKINSLSGSTLNDMPVLTNRAYSSVVTLKQGEAVEIVSELDKTQSRAISGTPGISEIPGLNDLTGNDKQTNFSSLLVIVTPHVVRTTQPAGHTPMMRLEKGTSTQ